MFVRTLPFVKVESVGNNFVLINALLLPEVDWPLLTRRMCSHHFGAGSDGLLAIVPPKHDNFGLRMFNPDGSEDVCGNGLRCAGAYVFLKGLHPRSDIVFEMKDGSHRVDVFRTGIDTVRVKVNMGRPSFRVQDIPAKVDAEKIVDMPIKANEHDYRLTCLSVGTPHAVIFEPLETFWERIPDVSGLIEKHPIFPEKISVNWCAVESRDALKIRTWERAVGPTMGCGTGACASLIAAHVCGLAGRKASVTSPGGTLSVEWQDTGEVTTEGIANIVYEAQWPLVGDEEGVQGIGAME